MAEEIAASMAFAAAASSLARSLAALARSFSAWANSSSVCESRSAAAFSASSRAARVSAYSPLAASAPATVGASDSSGFSTGPGSWAASDSIDRPAARANRSVTASASALRSLIVGAG